MRAGGQQDRQVIADPRGRHHQRQPAPESPSRWPSWSAQARRRSRAGVRDPSTPPAPAVRPRRSAAARCRRAGSPPRSLAVSGLLCLYAATRSPGRSRPAACPPDPAPLPPPQRSPIPLADPGGTAGSNNVPIGHGPRAQEPATAPIHVLQPGQVQTGLAHFADWAKTLPPRPLPRTVTPVAGEYHLDYTVVEIAIYQTSSGSPRSLQTQTRHSPVSLGRDEIAHNQRDDRRDHVSPT